MGWVGKGKGSTSRGGSATSELFQNNSIFSINAIEVMLSLTDSLLALTYSFFAFFSLLEKTETLDKKGDPHTKKGPLLDLDILKGTHLGTMQVLEAFFGCPFAAQQPAF